MPVPSATQVNGEAAINVGILVFSSINSNNPINWDVPPVSTIPLSIISDDSSGGVDSKIEIISFIIFSTLPWRDYLISFWFIFIIEGRPVIKFLPFTSIVISFGL